MSFVLIKVAACVALVSLFTPTLNAQTIVKERPRDIVDILTAEPSIAVEMMYATSDNFTAKVVPGYNSNICFVTESAAQGLRNAQARLQKKANGRHLTLVMKDCYRPHKSVQAFVAWANDPHAIEMKKRFYPDLAKEESIKQNYISPISGHSRASSIDLAIAEVSANNSLKLLDMGSIVDFFGEPSHTAYPKITSAQKANRQLLLDVMTPEFKNYSKEWWHFVLKTEPYPKTNFDFDIEVDHARDPQATPETLTQISQPGVLAELDREAKASFLALFKRVNEQMKLPVPTATDGASSTGAALSKFEATYGVFAKTMSEDIARVIKEIGIDWEKDITKTYDPKSAKTEDGKKHRANGNVTRIFNDKWLTSTDGQYILAGVVNRIDRKDFDPSHCGEIRFIYRQGYEVKMSGKTYASRMPFTVNMVFSYKNDGQGCREVASLWQSENLSDESGAAVAKKLLDGPLNFSRLEFKQMEVNSQIARIPSDLERETDRRFAGQAIYWMRIFGPATGGKFRSQKLENTPDVQAILKDPQKQKDLRAYITGHLADIDTGVYRLPDELSADVALSYSTLGSSRVANKPFNLLMTEKQAQELLGSAGAMKFTRDGATLLERLNTSSCMGCHQSSSTAGFHFLGADRSDFGSSPSAVKTALDGNRLQLPFSPHFYAEIPRRRHYVDQLAAGLTTNSFRPHPSAPAGSWKDGSLANYTSAGSNMACLLPGDQAIAPSWKCDADRGFSCLALVTNASEGLSLGQCAPSAKKIFAGLSCRKAAIADSTSASGLGALLAYNVRSFKDRVTTDDQIYGLGEGAISSTAYNCRPTRIGVPLGRVTKACTSSELSLTGFKAERNPDEICAVVGGKGFEQMAKGYFDSGKFADGVGRGMLNTCSPSRACREDYICQEMPDFLTSSRFNVSPETLKAIRTAKMGFCTPTYFVYQLRLDGHPNPK